MNLYKKDSKGKLRVWKIYVENDEIIEQYGLIDGKHAESRKIATPKNVGRSNETSGAEQAVLEMNSKIAEKLSKDYFATVKEVENTVVMLPMLATAFAKVENKIDWSSCMVQPKLDGMRAFNEGKFTSRTGKDIPTMNHILNETKGIDAVLDGELYAHGLSFQENMKLIKKYRPGTSETVKHHVYDLVSDQPFKQRYAMLKSLVEGLEHVKLVPTNNANSFGALVEWHTYYLSQGYEGTILRWGNEGYELNSRSKHLVKYKDFRDLACEIVNVIPMDARPDQGVVVCIHNGKTFKATPKMSHTDRSNLLLNKTHIIGKTAEIRYFEETDDGIPRFPVYLGIRLDK